MKSLLVFLFLFSFGFEVQSQEEPSTERPGVCTSEIKIDGAIGPASLDWLQRSLERTTTKGCSSLLMLINTPGGNLQTTRMIVEAILNAPVPVLCLVHPSGGHAGSAGAIILQACHVSGAMVATNIGAATPIAGSGKEMPEDLRKKLLNDTRSWLEGLTKLRGRDEDFGRDIILEAKAVSAKEALEIGAIDFVAKNKQEFLDFADGREVKMQNEVLAEVRTGELISIEEDLRHKVVAFVTDPQAAYLIFMGSLALLYFELTHPGTMVPGVIGTIGLVVSMVSLHKLDVTWGGLALILLGLVLMVAEAFVPSFGVLGLGGIAAFVMGSIFLFDTAETGYVLPMDLIFMVAGILALLMILVAYLAVQSKKVRRRGSYDDFDGAVGKVADVNRENPKEGQIEIRGELWSFESPVELKVNDKVSVTGYTGLTLKVKPIKE